MSNKPAYIMGEEFEPSKVRLIIKLLLELGYSRPKTLSGNAMPPVGSMVVSNADRTFEGVEVLTTRALDERIKQHEEKSAGLC